LANCPNNVPTLVDRRINRLVFRLTVCSPITKLEAKSLWLRVN
jgi:hypothetical protein